ncbi:hypothetical protein BpHYR1_022795 [Brachionus plicatilis]|uniref:Uncharacterized protein n=1 Tax=Brachionus plicatilis TaxID=10195 RepID=A0A3M7PU73_BRAPC|nr:hypothetical protein BpHYR1_022795 [Brachionus plicatilis]
MINRQRVQIEVCDSLTTDHSSRPGQQTYLAKFLFSDNTFLDSTTTPLRTQILVISLLYNI